MKTYNFKQLIEEVLNDRIMRDDEKITYFQEIVDAVEIDDILIHEDDWEGEKPGKDIELFGEHWFLDYWTAEDGDPMEGFRTIKLPEVNK